MLMDEYNKVRHCQKVHKQGQNVRFNISYNCSNQAPYLNLLQFTSSVYYRKPRLAANLWFSLSIITVN